MKLVNCPNCGALIKYGQSYCNVCNQLTRGGMEVEGLLQGFEIKNARIYKFYVTRKYDSLCLYGIPDYKSKFLGCITENISDTILEFKSLKPGDYKKIKIIVEEE